MSLSKSSARRYSWVFPWSSQHTSIPDCFFFQFPSYLKENDGKIKLEDKQRYVSQQVIVSKILAIFEGPNYSENNREQGAQVVGLMNEVLQLSSCTYLILTPASVDAITWIATTRDHGSPSSRVRCRCRRYAQTSRWVLYSVIFHAEGFFLPTITVGLYCVVIYAFQFCTYTLILHNRFVTLTEERR